MIFQTNFKRIAIHTREKNLTIFELEKNVISQCCLIKMGLIRIWR